MNEHVLVMLPHPDDESLGLLVSLHKAENAEFPSHMHAGHLEKWAEIWEARHMRTVKHFLN